MILSQMMKNGVEFGGRKEALEILKSSSMEIK